MGGAKGDKWEGFVSDKGALRMNCGAVGRRNKVNMKCV